MSVQVFERKAPTLMARLMKEFPAWGVQDTAACAGNGGGESGGFTSFQEVAPTVKGSLGGFGWFQWTGPRRRAYMAWCKKQGYDPKDDDANIGYLIVELKGDERHTIAAVAAAKGLEAKVKAFERAFERAGKPNYPGRVRWAQRALQAWNNSGLGVPHVDKPVALDTPITSHDVIKHVQKVLADLKYAPGGDDGKWGPLTETAVLAFRADNKLPIVPQIDNRMIEALATAKPREMIPARAEATPTQVAAVVPEANMHWWTRLGAVATGATGVVAGGADFIAPARSYVDQLRDYATDVPGYVWIGLVVIVCGVLYYVSQHGLNKATEAYQNGERK